MMEENIRLELFRVQQVRDWLKTGVGERGLSELIIPRTRAWAIVNGPYAQDDDPVVVVIFVGDNIAAHVATFPEMINGERYWYFPDLWCAPEYRGQGYSLIVMGTIAEMFGVEHCMDKWAAQEAVNVFTYLGLKTTYLPRYILGAKPDRFTRKGQLVAFVRAAQKSVHKLIERRPRREEYSLRYVPYVDDKLYAFIASQRHSDYILHTKEFLNWVLQYSFTIPAPLIERVDNMLSFASAETSKTQLFAVEVLDNAKTIAFYLLKLKEDELHVIYLYYDETQKTKVFASIRDHVICMHVEQCMTENKELADYLRRQIYFPKCSIVNISFSYPSTLEEPKSGHVQYGDGDCFAL